MKSLLKKSGYKFVATAILLVFFQTAVLAEDGKSSPSNGALSSGQVITFLAILLAIVVIPAFKNGRKIASNNK